MRSRILRRSSSHATRRRPGRRCRCAAALRPGQLGRFAQARRHVAQARDLHLGARGARAGVAMKDFEDDHGAVHYLAADLLLKVARLRGGNLVVDQDDVSISWLSRLAAISSNSAGSLFTKLRISCRLPVPRYAVASKPERFCTNVRTTSYPSVFASSRSSLSDASNSVSLTLGSCTAARRRTGFLFNFSLH